MAELKDYKSLDECLVEVEELQKLEHREMLAKYEHGPEVEEGETILFNLSTRLLALNVIRREAGLQASKIDIPSAVKRLVTGSKLTPEQDLEVMRAKLADALNGMFWTLLTEEAFKLLGRLPEHVGVRARGVVVSFKKKEGRKATTPDVQIFGPFKLGAEGHD